VAIRGDRILAVGTLAAVEQAAGPSARKVDLKGKFLMPGMIDAHAHPIDGGLTLIQANFVDTSDRTSLAACDEHHDVEAAGGASRWTSRRGSPPSVEEPAGSQ
jgi:predicted amidohydrolase YtcJ